MKSLTLKASAKHTGVSKSKIWRAVNDGTLIANMGRTSGGQEAWLVRMDHLERWAKTYLNDSEIVEDVLLNESDALEEPGTLKPDNSDSDSFNHAFHSYSQPPQVSQGPPVELYLALVDKVSRSERRSVELEIELRKYRLLLTENAESIVEREAKIKEAEAKVRGVSELVLDRERERDIALAKAKEEAERLKDAEMEIEKTKAENQRMTEQLKEARSEIAGWEERRKAPFWKRLFRGA